MTRPASLPPAVAAWHALPTSMVADDGGSNAGSGVPPAGLDTESALELRRLTSVARRDLRDVVGLLDEAGDGRPGALVQIVVAVSTARSVADGLEPLFRHATDGCDSAQLAGEMHMTARVLHDLAQAVSADVDESVALGELAKGLQQVAAVLRLRACLVDRARTTEGPMEAEPAS